jgi:hypothetical protein
MASAAPSDACGPASLHLNVEGSLEQAKEETPSREFPFPGTPYDIQVKFMNNLYDAIERGGFGVFESPTGTVLTRRTLFNKLGPDCEDRSAIPVKSAEMRRVNRSVLYAER